MRAYFIVSKILGVGACVWCLWAGYWLWTTPLTSGGRYLSEISGFGALPLVVPVVISLIALWSIFQSRTVMFLIATILLAVFWLISGFSIGFAYTPAVLLLIFVCMANLIAFLLTRKVIAEY